MNADATQPPEIRPIPPEQYRQALALLLDRLAEVDRQRQVAMAVAAGQIDRGAMPGLLGAYRGQEMAGVGLRKSKRAGRPPFGPRDSLWASRPLRLRASWMSCAAFWPPATSA